MNRSACVLKKPNTGSPYISLYTSMYIGLYNELYIYTWCPKKIEPFFLGAQCVESGVSCTDCY